MNDNKYTDNNKEIQGITDMTPHPDVPGWTIRFNAWRKRNIPDLLFLIILSIITGLIAGFAAFLFKTLISLISKQFISRIEDHTFNWWIIIVPVAGILITGIFTRYIVRTNLTHGVAQLMRDIKHKTFRLRHNITFSPIVGGSITLGMGGSSGAEGPIAYTGAAIGSNIAQFLGLDKNMMKTLVGCGTSAGIAGIFSAPIGGLMFGLELLHIDLSVNAILATVTACLTAYLTVFACKGFNPDLTFLPNESYTTEMIPLVLLLGVFCGLYCLYYSSITSRLDTFYKKISNPWIRNITGGLFIGTILFLFPSMFSVGYPVIGDVINGDGIAITKGSIIETFNLGDWSLMATAIGILLCKCWAVASTNSSGGVGGDFAPTFFAGSIAGFLFATFCNHYFDTQLPVGVFAYLGMAGVMAGAIEAPLMTIFITLEMTQTYRFSLPIVLCVMTSYVFVKGTAWLCGHHHPMVIHHRWFSHERPESTVNSKS